MYTTKERSPFNIHLKISKQIIKIHETLFTLIYAYHEQIYACLLGDKSSSPYCTFFISTKLRTAFKAYIISAQKLTWK